MDRLRNYVIRGDVSVMKGLAGRVENCMPRYFGHVEHMDSEKYI